jgi:hypothetical protein
VYLHAEGFAWWHFMCKVEVSTRAEFWPLK